MSPRRTLGRASLKTLLATAAVTGALGVTLIGGAAASASSITPNVADGSTATVCSDHLALRLAPHPDAADQGTLYKGDNVLVYSHAGEGMLHVHAYGDLHRDGWVDGGHFC